MSNKYSSYNVAGHIGQNRPLTGTTHVDNFLDHAVPYSFKYKDPSNAPTSNPAKASKPFLGTMAQSLERDPFGKQIVEDTPGGKVLNGPPLISALTASVGRLHNRLDANENSLAEMRGLLASQGQHHKRALSAIAQHEQMISKIHSILNQKFNGPKPPKLI